MFENLAATRYNTLHHTATHCNTLRKEFTRRKFHGDRSQERYSIARINTYHIYGLAYMRIDSHTSTHTYIHMYGIPYIDSNIYTYVWDPIHRLKNIYICMGSHISTHTYIRMYGIHTIYVIHMYCVLTPSIHIC